MRRSEQLFLVCKIDIGNTFVTNSFPYRDFLHHKVIRKKVGRKVEEKKKGKPKTTTVAP
jgi:hypothetical protein